MSGVRKVIVCSSALALVGAAGAQPTGGPPPARVRVDAARMETVERMRSVTGEIQAVRLAQVASEEAGLVVELAVEVGSTVVRGEVIARLSDDRRRLDVERLEAEVRGAEAEVRENEAKVAKEHRDLERLESLQARAGASQNEVDDARTELAEAVARLARAQADQASARAEVQTARTRLEDLTVVAPFDGSVTAKETEIGQWVREGDTIVELVELSRVDAVLNVPERFVRRLRERESIVQLELDALDEGIEAPVHSIVARGDRMARTFPVLVRIENGEHGLRPGMSVRAMVPTGEPIEALTIHKDALMRSEVGVFVWAEVGGRAKVMPLEPIFARGERVVVRSPALEEGTAVVIEGNERLFPGQPLKIDGAPERARVGGARSGGK